MNSDASDAACNQEADESRNNAAGDAHQPSTESCLREVKLGQGLEDRELVFGLVGAVGSEPRKIAEILANRLRVSGYEVSQVHISQDVIPQVAVKPLPGKDEYDRISTMMDAGNEARRRSADNSILALGAASWISSHRGGENESPKYRPRHAYIINSLKHPDEVLRLREIYTEGFYLIGVHSDDERRQRYLVDEKRISPEKALELMLRDQDEHLPHGQQVADTFHLSDFFIRIEDDDDRLKHDLWRILDILFGDPYKTPIFDEYAMFLAFAASVRSADLSRQVGAVIAKDQEIIATGANDCPRYGGGLYWPKFDKETKSIKDTEGGRDYTRGGDSNKLEQQKIIDEILEKAAQKGIDKQALREALEGSRIRDLTEFGRVVHAEMEALLSCARNNLSARNGTLYCTTFPCHNCAKHIIAAGIKRVVYIEPYQKSKAAEFHQDCVRVGFGDGKHHVRFEPFVGVGPRRFFDLFSLHLGSGNELRRKDKEGRVVPWKPEDAHPRLQLLPCSYLDLELVASDMFNKARIKENTDGR